MSFCNLMETLVALFLLSLFGLSMAEIPNKIGVNYGMLGNNLPSPARSIELIQSMKFSRVKLYDANPEVLNLLSGTKLQASIMVQNHEISGIGSSQAIADEWVRNNVLLYYPDTIISFILVGNEVLSSTLDQDRELWRDLVPAMRRIRASLRAKGIRTIKVSTPLAMDVVESTFPPSSAKFRSDISESVMEPLLRFLNGTRSHFFVDVYPYFPWSGDPTNIDLDFALLQGNYTYTDPGSRLVYTNLLDQMLDSITFAMSKLGYEKIPLVIAETGWPNGGDLDQSGVNVHNAAIYNRNLIKKLTAKPPSGTPARPGVNIPTFIFSLYDEDQKTGPGSERHWGLLHPNGTSIYEIDLTGKRPISQYKSLPLPTNNEPCKGELWCVVAREANLTELRLAIEYACASGNGTCDALMPGGECQEPVSEYLRASYAFSSFWARFRSQGATCYFNGLAEQTTSNPSRGSCKVPSVTF
ncbi:probable glucan endo-1,3-beta-glucosidase A6 [Punica granatum]|uniref:glucan endo-1,3-beta-D-glucosidase n=2 Tax=Punica granatum TaxID=22663 RepID=A0A6P8E8P2_PUNGR|nr:probable glucan endo-1,3-beta-glucosidase A6 [Punica granatum]